MSILKPIGDLGYVKAGLTGFQGGGKTHTAALLAIGIREHFGLDAPIVMFDTELGAPGVKEMIESATGKPLLGVQSRSFDALMETAKAAENEGSVLLADSTTHVWRECIAAYMAEINEIRAERGFSEKQGMGIQDWSPVKQKFWEWSDFFLNSKLHIIACGRAGHEYEDGEPDELGRVDLQKAGLKMLTEKEFAYEPALMIEMAAVTRQGQWVRKARVVKDRFSAIDGQEFYQPTFDDFLPHVEKLVKGAHASIDMTSRTHYGLDGSGDAQWKAEKRRRDVACEEIKAWLENRFPGQAAANKGSRSTLLLHLFKTRSWIKVEGFSAQTLEDGLNRLLELLDDPAKLAEALGGGS